MHPPINYHTHKAIHTYLVFLIIAASLFLTEMAHSNELTIIKDRFSGLLKVTFLKDGQLVRLDESLTFFDSSGKEWTALKGMTSDGASIPNFVWPIVGPPFRGPYVRAAIVHDQYCYSRTEPSDEVHKMFRDAMIVGKVPSWKVTFMYGAVLWKGPKWDATTVENARKLFRQYYYDGEKGFKECLEKGDIKSSCYSKYFSANYMPRKENYAMPQASYEICGKSQCTWTELKGFEDQWMFKNSGVGVTAATEEEVKSLLDKARNAPGDYEAMEKFVTINSGN